MAINFFLNNTNIQIILFTPIIPITSSANDIFNYGLYMLQES